jgi:hypothetical protein
MSNVELMVGIPQDNFGFCTGSITVLCDSAGPLRTLEAKECGPATCPPCSALGVSQLGSFGHQ